MKLSVAAFLISLAAPAVASDVFITTQSTGEIRQLDPTSGAVIATNVGGVTDGRGLAFSPTQKLFVACGSSVKRVDGLSTSTTIVDFVTEVPYDLTFDAVGRMYVVTDVSVHTFGPSGVLAPVFPHGLSATTGDGNARKPWSIAVRPDNGEVFVTGKEGVRRFDPATGTALGTFGGFAHWGSSGLAFTDSDHSDAFLYVGEVLSGTDRIEVYDRDLVFLRHFFANHNGNPIDLEVDRATDDLYVINTINPAGRFDSQETLVVPAVGPAGRGVAVGSFGCFSRVITSNAPARALPLAGPLSTQLALLNAAPPDFDPATWQPVARQSDVPSGTTFVCGSELLETSGSVIVETPPANIFHNQWESSTHIRVFPEKLDWTLRTEVQVDVENPLGTYDEPSDVPAGTFELGVGTTVSSYLLHFDTDEDDNVTLGGSVSFTTPILGVIFRGEQLIDSDLELGLRGTTYTTTLTERGLELHDPTDFFTVSADQRTITVGARVMNWLDEVRVVVAPAGDPLDASYVETTWGLPGIDEVTADNCSSAWYRFTFSLPVGFRKPALSGVANVDDQGVVFLNGNRISATMSEPGCDPVSLPDPCYDAQDTGKDRNGVDGMPVLTSPTPDAFFTDKAAFFRAGRNELVFAVCGDASPFEPTGLEFTATVCWEPTPPVVIR